MVSPNFMFSLRWRVICSSVGQDYSTEGCGIEVIGTRLRRKRKTDACGSSTGDRGYKVTLGNKARRYSGQLEGDTKSKVSRLLSAQLRGVWIIQVEDNGSRAASSEEG